MQHRYVALCYVLEMIENGSRVASILKFRIQLGEECVRREKRMGKVERKEQPSPMENHHSTKCSRQSTPRMSPGVQRRGG